MIEGVKAKEYWKLFEICENIENTVLILLLIWKGLSSDFWSSILHLFSSMEKEQVHNFVKEIKQEL